MLLDQTQRAITQQLTNLVSQYAPRSARNYTFTHTHTNTHNYTHAHTHTHIDSSIIWWAHIHHTSIHSWSVLIQLIAVCCRCVQLHAVTSMNEYISSLLSMYSVRNKSILYIWHVLVCSVFYSHHNMYFLVLLSRFLPQIKETRREFVRIGEDLETAAGKNAQISRHKATEAERASHLLIATRKCYQHFALDYCLQVMTA